mmetsp:Transcript_20315/g.64923  ORF Transcript_20315/g.64923 Transcript_20315/m.64923 type:complete len:292 (-) Transcript_20315:473-1348(-)
MRDATPRRLGASQPAPPRAPALAPAAPPPAPPAARGPPAREPSASTRLVPTPREGLAQAATAPARLPCRSHCRPRLQPTQRRRRSCQRGAWTWIACAATWRSPCPSPSSPCPSSPSWRPCPACDHDHAHDRHLTHPPSTLEFSLPPPPPLPPPPSGRGLALAYCKRQRRPRPRVQSRPRVTLAVWARWTGRRRQGSAGCDRTSQQQRQRCPGCHPGRRRARPHSETQEGHRPQRPPPQGLPPHLLVYCHSQSLLPSPRGPLPPPPQPPPRRHLSSPPRARRSKAHATHPLW